MKECKYVFGVIFFQSLKFMIHHTASFQTFNLFILIGFSMLFYSCGTDSERPQLMEGSYSGTFTRGEESSPVELTFENGKFKGSSEAVKFPAICNGTYRLSGNLLEFQNACPWTAEFDWSLILSGSWNFQVNKEQLILTNSLGDQYSLNPITTF